jgi:hypothetical protein
MNKYHKCLLFHQAIATGKEEDEEMGKSSMQNRKKKSNEKE